ERRIDDFLRRDTAAFGLPDRSALPHAYCEATAVSIWTDGGYWTGFTRGFRPLHLRVRRADLPAWRAFFRAAGARASLAGARETLVGGYAVSAYGPPRFSLDLDFVVPAAALPGIRGLLQSADLARIRNWEGAAAFAGRAERWSRGEEAIPLSVDLLIDGISDRVSG